MGVHSVGQMVMGILKEQGDSLNEFGWVIVREIDSSSVKCVRFRICVDCVLT